MITVIVFIIILGLLIFVHELGHFLVARRNGIRAEEFGFGFPPRAVGLVKNKKNGKYKFVWGNKQIKSEDTVYSLNWVPLGGFVKIKGENGEGENDPDSFASRSAWTRIKVLAAGVTMNFILAWILISFALSIGAPQAIEDSEKDAKNVKIQIAQVVAGSPADIMGLKIGDELVKCVPNGNDANDNSGQKKCGTIFSTKEDVQNAINDFKNKEVVLEVKRGDTVLNLKGTPRAEYPEGQGPLGISLARTAIVSYPVHQAIIKGLQSTYDIALLITLTLSDIIRDLLSGRDVAVDVSGPVGIAILTKQVTTMGFVYILQFAALLSINLGLINAFPFPALDGGRILFILIEKIKGSPVNQKIENIAHTVGFTLLIALMIFITARDFMQFDILNKIKGLF